MSESFLIPINDYSPTLSAFDHALAVGTDPDITIIHVINIGNKDRLKDIIPDAVEEEQKAAEQAAKQLLEYLQHYADEHGVQLRIVTEYGRPAKQINAYAINNSIDQIIMGSHSRTGLSRLLLGSFSETVLRQTSIPVTIVPLNYENTVIDDVTSQSCH